MTGLLAAPPVIDDGVAMIPGLNGQSRVENNTELRRLHLLSGPLQPEHSAVRSNFEPADPGWQFWKRFRAGFVADVGADLVFDGENDMVVDTISAISLAGGLGGAGAPPLRTIPPGRTLDFGTNGTVHHLNYFAQERTIRFLAKQLQLR